ncbi:MAG TPA: TonB-dependent receptor plug domain-containing protein [Allosphingosinicella sp.]|nr:TonB-dependent receptor plug domain-containing protein [Allosphingosinicella sp.]
MIVVSAAGRTLAAYLLASAAVPALAQSAEPTGNAAPPVAPAPATVEGSRTYTPADFARFAPRNALDMLRQVPGFVIREASQERGLGQATGNVLINGQRISGKSNDALSELSRIPSTNVTRIEILDGATLDIPGLSGQVANIVATASGKMTGQFAWEPSFRQRNTDPVFTRGNVSVSGSKGPVEYTLGLQNNSGTSGANGRTLIYNPDLSVREFRNDKFTGESENPRLSGRLTYDGPGSSTGNLNGSYQRFYYDYRERGTRIGDPALPDRVRLVANDEDSYSWELGGDYEIALGGGRLKFIGLNRFEHVPFGQDLRISFANNSPDIGSRFLRTGDEKEQIARTEYKWKAGGADWQISGEAAFNSLDNVSELFLLRPNGEYELIDLPGSTARVKEDRYELMGSYGRTLSPKLSIQLAAGGEYSSLSQAGGGGLSRAFWRPKGQFSAAWKPNPRTDVNVRLQRRVGQLNFYDFLATVNLGDNRENAGNPDLVPSQTWHAEVEGVRNLGAYGSTTLRVYGQLIDDIVDIVPIGATGESPGNLESARIWGAEWKTTFQFDPLGWKGAKLDARVQLQKSEVEDPLTGETRPISGSLQRLVTLSLRHDIPDSDWAWGGSMSHEWYAKSYRLTQVGRQWEGPVWSSLFVENKDVFGLTVRATVNNITAARSIWDRIVYLGRRTGPVDYIERRDRLIGPIFSFSLRGKF